MPTVVADLEVHSRFARACSKALTPKLIAEWARKKGTDLVGSADFTHPTWLAECKDQLKEDGSGFLTHKEFPDGPKFALSAEVSCIYRRDDATRRVHLLLYLPSFEAVEKFNSLLLKDGANLHADGRPILGMDSQKVLEHLLTADPRGMLIPAHAWTPWFGIFGSKSGFDSIEQAFGPLTRNVPAIETGLSSDPPMNWRLSQLDPFRIVSFSDAHSAPNLGREATELELAKMNYDSLADAFWGRGPSKILKTYEYFPEEGMYHFDGHREHEIRWSPTETAKHKGICTVCNRPVTVGVLSRTESLADRPPEFAPKDRPPFVHVIPLDELISVVLGKGPGTKTVQTLYESMIAEGKSEFRVLLDAPETELKTYTPPEVVGGILRTRAGKVTVLPGYDGVYGTVQLFSEAERKAQKATLF
jgi:uncharacterized protein (TIGR00375 family)